MAHCEPMNLIEFQERFPNEEACEDYLFNTRWPDGFHCPKCGNNEFYFHSSRQLFQCTNPKCCYQISLTAGTIMHKTRTPLHKWFWAIFLCSRDKRGISALALSKQIGISYWVAWSMLQKIREAMINRDSQYILEGLIETDDAFIGSPGGKPGRGTEKAKIVVSTSVTEEGKPQFAKMDVVDDHSEASLSGHIDKTIKRGSKITTDGFKGYSNLDKKGYTHKVVSSPKLLPWVHILISNVKAFIAGTYHGVSNKHLRRYLAEYCYRFNRRFWESQLFGRLVNAVVNSSPVTYAELTQ